MNQLVPSGNCDQWNLLSRWRHSSASWWPLQRSKFLDQDNEMFTRWLKHFCRRKYLTNLTDGPFCLEGICSRPISTDRQWGRGWCWPNPLIRWDELCPCAAVLWRWVPEPWRKLRLFCARTALYLFEPSDSRTAVRYRDYLLVKPFSIVTGKISSVQTLPLSDENPFILLDNWLTRDVINNEPLSPEALALNVTRVRRWTWRLTCAYVLNDGIVDFAEQLIEWIAAILRQGKQENVVLIRRPLNWTRFSFSKD